MIVTFVIVPVISITMLGIQVHLYYFKLTAAGLGYELSSFSRLMRCVCNMSRLRFVMQAVNSGSNSELS